MSNRKPPQPLSLSPDTLRGQHVAIHDLRRSVLQASFEERQANVRSRCLNHNRTSARSTFLRFAIAVVSNRPMLCRRAAALFRRAAFSEPAALLPDVHSGIG